MSSNHIERLSNELISRAAKLATSTFANALDDRGFHDKVLNSIKSVSAGMTCAGRAVTIQETIAEYGTYTSADFRVGAIVDAAQAGDIVVIDMGGAKCSTWGGMASLAAKHKGIEGLLVDGGVRDLEEMIEFEFPVFARHLVPTTGRGRLKVESINQPVRLDEVLIEPGDLIVADGSGVVCLPKSRAADIVSLAEEMQRDDDVAVAEIRNGLSFSDAMRKFTRI
ncbi:MAG: RraA family protein [Gammaproteobacteria bacterium]|nr:RraA family protein [Gammaproteobacteria bacterium]